MRVIIALALLAAACTPIQPCQTSACLAYRASLYNAYMAHQRAPQATFYPMQVQSPQITSCHADGYGNLLCMGQ